MLVVFHASHCEHFLSLGEGPRGKMTKVLDYALEGSEFELRSRYYVYFQTKTPEKGIEPHYPCNFGLNSITMVHLHRWLRYQIVYEDSYAIE